jgi:hypothetical protein
MRKNVMTLFLLLASSFVKGLAPYRKNSMDLVKLKASLFYIKSIKTSRLLFMSLLGVGVCLIFLFGGLILFHATLFLYAPWSAQTKLAVGLVFSAIYLAVTIAAFFYVFSPNQWLRIFHVDQLIEDLAQKAQASSPEPEPVAQRRNGNKYRKTFTEPHGL